ncbi:MAG: transposase [Candidatus Cloacimonetes bacterium]|nr:transposase [Candidatus Cloacimonadota bacterium]
MIDTKERKLSKTLQVKFHKYIQKSIKGFTLPEQKFIKRTTFGILSGKTCIVRQISQTLKEEISLKKTCKRLSYHLDKGGFDRSLSDNLLQVQCRKITKESIIIPDPSDIMKKYAEKMEGMSKVHDGSENKWVNGYNLLDFIAVNEYADNELTIEPLVSDLSRWIYILRDLYSNYTEYETLKTKFFNRVNDIQVYSNNKGIYTLDRGYDDRKVISYLYDNEADFIIRSGTKRDLYYKGQKICFVNVAKEADMKYEFSGRSKSERIVAGLLSVEIPIDPHPRKDPTLVLVNLIVARYKINDKLKGFFYLFSSFPHFDLSEKEIIQKSLHCYKIRWKIEEVHRQVKSDFKWESMQVMTYQRLKTLNALMWIAIGFLYKMNSMKWIFAKTFSYFMLDKKRRLKELSKFIYYRIANVISYCFQFIKKYEKIIYQKQPKSKIQLEFQFT